MAGGARTEHLTETALPLSAGAVSPDADAALMARVKQGDREAFGTLVDRYKDQIVNYLARLTGSTDRAHDLAQETFLRLYRTAGRYEERGQLPALIYRIATNLVRSEERRARRVRFFSFDFNSHDRRDARPGPQAGLLRDEATERVSEALAALPLPFRVPLVLHEIEGWSVPEIAASIEVPEGTVKSRISRAKDKLRETLAPYWQGVSR